MCGIAGYLNLTEEQAPPSESLLRQMLAMIRHRGPDEFGVYLDDQIGLGNARLSIIDLAAGQQPFATEDERYWIVYNGEIFNHQELRRGLVERGHQLTTHCDTEVFLHLFEEEGPKCLSRLNGQFAVAIWDAQKHELFIARDRLGIRPLYFTNAKGAFIFGSEIKSIACHPSVNLEFDPGALDQIFTSWSALPPRTPFQNVQQLLPGCFATISAAGTKMERYWQPDFDRSAEEPGKSDADYLHEFRELLDDATRLRLMADVPVGSYLSGGLDSSIIASLARRHVGKRLDTFSIAFTDAAFDERDFQQEMARHIGTEHQVIEASHADIGNIFPEVIWHTESPLLRTAPAPMFLLSQLVNRSGYKVVLTGEGADEFLGGYDIFKETMIRRFWSREPGSTWRSSLFQRIYPDLTKLAKLGPKYLASFFGERLTDVDAPDYSHAVRWRNTRRTQRFFSADLNAAIQQNARTVADQLEIPAAFKKWDGLSQAQFIEIITFLSPYLLSFQGDRVAMAHSVEGRFPFLDYRMVEFCNKLPARLKLRGLQDKRILRMLGREFLPESIWNRPKKPYRAPIHRSFFNEHTADYVEDLLSEKALNETGLFNPAAVSNLTGKIKQGRPVGETDDMALVGIISTQLVHHRFVQDFRTVPTLSENDDVKICDRRTAPASMR